MMEVLFWVSLFLVFYTFAGFFILTFLLGLLRKNPVEKGEIEPTVSLIIAAYNEEKVIREKIENSLALDYPKDKLEIVVVSDGSTDRTPEIVKEYESQGIRSLFEPPRRGKTMAINRSVPLTHGEIVFFSDANTDYAPGTVRAMVRNFHDKSVGGVCGRKVVRVDKDRDATSGEKGFWGYEATLKRLQTEQGSISTADGEIFAVRRSMFELFPERIVHDDMYLTLRIVQKGFRVVYEWDAISAESASKSLKDEFFLKTRYASAGFQILKEFRSMLFPPRSWFAFQFLSHKLLRWTVSFFLILLFVSNLFLSHPAARVFLWLQLLFYCAAALGGLFLLWRIKSRLLYFPLYFCMGNGAGLYSLFKLLGKPQTVLWRKAER